MGNFKNSFLLEWFSSVQQRQQGNRHIPEIEDRSVQHVEYKLIQFKYIIQLLHKEEKWTITKKNPNRV